MAAAGMCRRMCRRNFPNTLESFSETAARLGLTPSSDVLRAAEAPATLDEAEELGIAPGSPLFHLDRIRRLDGVPVAVDTSFFAGLDEPGSRPASIFATASLFGLLIGAGVDLARGETTIEAHAADAGAGASSRHRGRQTHPGDAADSSSTAPGGRCCRPPFTMSATATGCARRSRGRASPRRAAALTAE